MNRFVSIREGVDPFGGAGSSRCRSGRTGCAPRNLRRIALTLAFAALIPWLPLNRSGPASPPSARAAGSSTTPIFRLAFGPDGRTLATTDEMGRATLWRSGGGWGPDRAVAAPGHARPIAFTPDGRYLAIGGDEPGVVLLGLRSEAPDRFLDLPFRWTFDLKISPDGRTLAACGADSRAIVLLDLDTGRKRMVLRGHATPPTHLAFGPDGRTLASAAGTISSASGTIEERAILLWDLDSGRLRRRLTGMPSTQLAIAFSPDGRLIAGAGSGEKPVRIWDVATGATVRMLPGHAHPVRSLAFSPDGRTLATAAGDGTAALWSVADGRALRRLDGQADVLRQVAFSPDGRTLAAAGNDGDVRFWGPDDLLDDRR